MAASAIEEGEYAESGVEVGDTAARTFLRTLLTTPAGAPPSRVMRCNASTR